MKNKNIVIGIIVAVAVVCVAILIKSPASKGVLKSAAMPASAKTSAKSPAKAPAKEPAKKVFSKDMGGLTVKMLNSKSREISARVRAFRVVDEKSSVYAASLSANKMQELTDGSYDIEIDTVPQKLYKNIRVHSGKETIEDIGATGAINIKAINSSKKDAVYPVKVMPARSNASLITGTTNKPVEIIPGVYDIEIGTVPAQFKKDVKVEAGKETIIDLGCATGSLSVKASDENKKEVRLGIRVRKAGSNETIISWTTNRSIEIMEGVYDIDVLSNPVQSRKDVKVNKGEEAAVEFTVSMPPVPAPRQNQPAKAAATEKTKK